MVTDWVQLLATEKKISFKEVYPQIKSKGVAQMRSKSGVPRRRSLSTLEGKTLWMKDKKQTNKTKSKCEG